MYNTGHSYVYGIYGKGCYYCYGMKQCTLVFAGRVYVYVIFVIFVRMFYSSSGPALVHILKGRPVSKYFGITLYTVLM